MIMIMIIIIIIILTGIVIIIIIIVIAHRLSLHVDWYQLFSMTSNDLERL